MEGSVALLRRKLSRFEIKEVHGLDNPDKKVGGEGCYGAVYEVTVNRRPYYAKQLHSVLIAPNIRPEERQGIYERFHKECLMLSELNHENIVRFVGVYFGSSRDREFDVSLIMEKLDTDLSKYLQDHPNVPLCQKLTVLLDVSEGLLYLHSRQPPIIHRDLTTSNILLTTDLQAKIADFGVSRALNISLNRLAAQTKCPGALAYMPPEALQQQPVYGKALDIFSFGEVCLCTICQKFAEVFDVTNEPDVLSAHRRGEVEILKRKRWLDDVPTDHCLRDILISCLRDKPDRRPTTQQLYDSLTRICIQKLRVEMRKTVLDCALKEIELLREQNAKSALRIAELEKHSQIADSDMRTQSKQCTAAAGQMKQAENSSNATTRSGAENDTDVVELQAKMEGFRITSDSEAQLTKEVQEKEEQRYRATQLVIALQDELYNVKETNVALVMKLGEQKAKMDQMLEQKNVELALEMERVRQESVKTKAEYVRILQEEKSSHSKAMNHVRKELERSKKKVEIMATTKKLSKLDAHNKLVRIQLENECLHEDIEKLNTTIQELERLLQNQKIPKNKQPNLPVYFQRSHSPDNISKAPDLSQKVLDETNHRALQTTTKQPRVFKSENFSADSVRSYHQQNEQILAQNHPQDQRMHWHLSRWEPPQVSPYNAQAHAQWPEEGQYYQHGYRQVQHGYQHDQHGYQQQPPQPLRQQHSYDEPEQHTRKTFHSSPAGFDEFPRNERSQSDACTRNPNSTFRFDLRSYSETPSSQGTLEKPRAKPRQLNLEVHQASHRPEAALDSPSPKKPTTLPTGQDSLCNMERVNWPTS